MASTEPYIGSIELWPIGFAPEGWAFCTGQIMSISTNTALYSLIGITYGGDGRTTFVLPDFRGRVPVGAGQGPGLSDYSLGANGGLEKVTLTIQELPSHAHNATATLSPQAASDASSNSSTSPIGNYNGPTANANYVPSPTGAMGQSTVNVTIQPVGEGQPFSILQPYLAVNYIIALTGAYPPRS